MTITAVSTSGQTIEIQKITEPQAFGFGVSDGADALEVCASSCQIGISGSAAGELNGPNSVATNAVGDVYVTDATNNRVNEYSPAGELISVLSGYGTGAGRMINPVGLAIDAAGDLYVADYGNDRVDEFASDGTFVKAFGAGVVDGANSAEVCTTATTCRQGQDDGVGGAIDQPLGIAVDGAGDVWVADHWNDRVEEFSPTGAFTQAVGDAVADGANQLESCTSSCEAGFNGTGPGGYWWPEGIAVDPTTGDIYVSDTFQMRINVLSPTGTFIKAFGWGVLDQANRLETCTTVCQGGNSGNGAGQLWYPVGITFDSAGNLLVADSWNNRIDEF